MQTGDVKAAYEAGQLRADCHNVDLQPVLRAAWCRIWAAYAEAGDTRREALIQEALAHTDAGMGELADRDFETLLDAYPDAPDVLRGWAQSLAQRGFYTDAMARYDHLLERTPEDAEVWLLRGQLAGRAEDFPRAIQDYDRAIALSPKMAAAYVARGDVYLAQDNLAAAKNDYSMANELEPGNADTMTRMGNVLYADGGTVAPLSLYRLALDIQPDHADAAFGAGRLTFEMGSEDNEFEQARKLLIHSIKKEPNNPIALFMLSLTHTRLGDAEKAAESLQLSFKKRPYLVGFYKVLLQDSGFPIEEESARLTPDVWQGLQACAARRCKLWD